MDGRIALMIVAEKGKPGRLFSRRAPALNLSLRRTISGARPTH
jgi:hypothetical protein